jgi:hypothetical protein
MLAATSVERDQSAAPFHVALQILSNERNLPAKLSAYMRTVLLQAVGIVRDPSTISAATLPEAIQLALDLQQSNELRTAVELVAEGKNLSPGTAKDILAAERRFAPPR